MILAPLLDKAKSIVLVQIDITGIQILPVLGTVLGGMMVAGRGTYTYISIIHLGSA